MATKKKPTKVQQFQKDMKTMETKLEQVAEKEIKKAKQEMQKAAKNIEQLIKRHPERAAMITAGIGAALGAASAMLISNLTKKKK